MWDADTAVYFGNLNIECHVNLHKISQVIINGPVECEIDGWNGFTSVFALLVILVRITCYIKTQELSLSCPLK